MTKKKLVFIALGAAVLALILAAVLLPRTGQTPQTPASPTDQTRPAETQMTVQTIPTESVQTEPMETEPEQTEPPATTQPTHPAETEPTETQPIETQPQPTAAPTEAPEIFPVLLEDGMLTVQSIFQYSGMNPDAALEFGENIAGLQLVNTSEQHLTQAEITALLDDGTALTFLVEDVAPGMTVMAFSPEQGVLDDSARCVEIWGDAEFEDGDPLHSDLVNIRVEGMAVTVTNVSGMDLTDLAIICHGLLDGNSFGGTAYTYRITSLSAGASATIYATDCILGMAQVTRVELGE